MLKRRFEASVVITRNSAGQLVHSERTLGSWSPSTCQAVGTDAGEAAICGQACLPGRATPGPGGPAAGQAHPPGPTGATQLRAAGTGTLLSSPETQSEAFQVTCQPFSACLSQVHALRAEQSSLTLEHSQLC